MPYELPGLPLKSQVESNILAVHNQDIYGEDGIMRETTKNAIFLLSSVLVCVSVASAQLPDRGMKFDPANTALV